MALFGSGNLSGNLSGLELFVVEGLSAANALSSVCDRRFQSVLPMQGKIPNASRTSNEKLLRHPQLVDLLRSIHPENRGEVPLTQFSFERVILLGDPDGDGLHATVLLVLFLSTRIPALVEQGRLYMVRAPLYGFYNDDECVALAYTDKQATSVAGELAEKYTAQSTRRRFKGIASLDENLRRSLIDKHNPARHRLSMMECERLCQPMTR